MYCEVFFLNMQVLKNMSKTKNVQVPSNSAISMLQHIILTLCFKIKFKLKTANENAMLLHTTKIAANCYIEIPIMSELHPPRVPNNIMRNRGTPVISNNLNSMVNMFRAVITMKLNNASKVVLPIDCIDSNCNWSMVSQKHQDHIFWTTQTVKCKRDTDIKCISIKDYYYCTIVFWKNYNIQNLIMKTSW